MAEQGAEVNLTLGAARRKWSDGKDIFFNATRALLMVRSPADARRVLTGTVLALGGQVVPAVSAGPHALPIDLSFGAGEPVVALVPPEGWARVLLERHLPTLVNDARNALELCSQVERLAGGASIDALTGLADRRVLGRAFGRLDEGDTVIMIDLDHNKATDDRLCHHGGDRVLRRLGQALMGTARAGDIVGRYGGDQFAVVLRAGADPEAFLERLRITWEAAPPQPAQPQPAQPQPAQPQPQPATFSAGIACARGAPYQRAEDQRRPQAEDLTTGPLPESGEWRYFQVVEKWPPTSLRTWWSHSSTTP
jgi:diguanylate cyclase (GGDEF)-like protein